MLIFIDIVLLQQYIKRMENPRQSGKVFKKPKVSQQLRANRSSSLNFSFDEIVNHCQKVTKTHPKQMGNCVDLNCEIQKQYVECFQVLYDKKRCIQVLSEEFRNVSTYRVSHIKWQ